MLNDIAKSFRLLGHRAKDRVTGVEGVVTTVTFDLYGCIQALIHPGVDKDDKLKEQLWFDVNRLEPISVDAARVMPLPKHVADFIHAADAELKPLEVRHQQGAAEKPPMMDRVPTR
jgi:hypothetical protein